MTTSKFVYVGLAGMCVVAILGFGASQSTAHAAEKFSMDAGCISCHEVETASQEDAGSLLGFHTAGGTQLGCIACHADEKGMEKAHAKWDSGKTAKRLKKTEVPSDVCVTCHDVQELAETTKDCEVLIDENGTVVNPHGLPVNEDHASITCVSCHEVHVAAEEGQAGEEKKAAGPSKKKEADEVPSELAKAATGTCASCHHAGVYECGTCHGDM